MTKSKRTIAHALFTYTDEAGAEQVAFRGAEVELSAKDIERGEKFDAFTKDGAEPEPAGNLVDFPLEGGQAEQDAWVKAAKVSEIIDAVNARPEIAAAVLEAEGRRSEKDQRTTLIASLSELVAQQ